MMGPPRASEGDWTNPRPTPRVIRPIWVEDAVKFCRNPRGARELVAGVLQAGLEFQVGESNLSAAETVGILDTV